MSVLRHIANRVHRLWLRSFLRLKYPARYLRRRERRRLGRHPEKRTGKHNKKNTASPYLPWFDAARQFFVLESFAQAISKNGGKNGGRPIGPARSRYRDAGSNRYTSVSGRAKSAMSAFSQRSWTVILLAFLLLSACFGQRFYSQPTLDVKAIAPQTFYAPQSVVFEDKKATELQRNNVRAIAEPVLKIDTEQTSEAFRSLETLLRQGRELRQQAGSPPFLNLTILSRPTQDFLFQASDTEWKTIWRLAEITTLSAAQLETFGDTPIPAESAEPAEDASPEDTALEDVESLEPLESPAAQSKLVPLPPSLAAQIRAFLPDQLAVLQELVAYRELAGEKGLAQLKLRVNIPRQQYRKAAAELALDASTEGQPLYNYRLFDLTEVEWLTLESVAQQVFSEMMTQGISPGLRPDLLRRAIEVQIPADLSPTVQQLTADVLSVAIVPNLIEDEEGTQKQAEQAVREITPVMVSVQEGELIVLAGEAIDAADFVRLDHFGLTRRYFNWIGLCGFSLLIAMAIAFYLWIDHRQPQRLTQRDHILVLVLCLFVSVLAFAELPTFGLPVVGLLIGSFYGSALGLTVIGLTALMLPIGTSISAIALLAGVAAAIVGTWTAPQLRAREEFALLGGFVGLTQGGVHLVLTLMRSTISVPLWKVMFVESAMHGLYGIAWSVVALGVSPYLEHFFDIVTPIRLAELSNPNRPLLKRLAAEAPGTFQHTISVSNLAEAAARALSRNVELVRAGTLYHDIGKMHDPLGFIENQMGGPNKHDLIDDPWLSASIIRKHVTQGLVMARKYRLPKAVRAFIPEHQGDMKISYFYQQAKERQAAEPSLVINEADFSYEGPIPQSPETGITMLADSCEAALRSLKPDASIDEAYTMVDRILRARWRNQQLIDSGLNREDMDVIASVFIQVWQQHNHKRISYPKNAQES